MIMSQRLFYEYAITPDVFDARYISGDQRLEVILPVLLKGIIENGMIANLNKDGWIKQLRGNRLPAVTPVKLKDQLLSLLSILDDRHRLVRHPKSPFGDPDNDSKWFAIALESHGYIKFDGIIATKKLLEEKRESGSDFIDCQNILNSTQWESRRRTLTLASCEPYYRPVIDPVLRHAKALTIVDPYFSPHVQKYMEFLRICIGQMGRRGQSPLPGRIHIHAGDPNDDRNYPQTVNDRLASWEQKLKAFYSGRIPHKIEVFLRKKKNSGKKFHDRFILTDQCCIEIPMGNGHVLKNNAE